MFTSASIQIICGINNHDYWRLMVDSIQSKLGVVKIVEEIEAEMIGEKSKIDLFVIEMTVKGSISRLIVQLRYLYPESKILIVTSSPSWQEAREVFTLGAVDYVRKSYHTDEMVSCLQSALSRKSIKSLMNFPNAQEEM